ncbi:hypothetical protein TESG_05068 [Trichophyton tonsurans CBS 112818]|uniref:Uncharacterized protein n=2 Tax=Trichophyton TaxID=5550 RepID=F2PS39_TRIEC|nr:hypothetical protein TESG_05068 [Trichophyton tonsurans CBS 112818]EGE04795.1 hypothetical protein TEQG_03968 [Trichophyton equinum CBS 127.97]
MSSSHQSPSKWQQTSRDQTASSPSSKESGKVSESLTLRDKGQLGGTNSVSGDSEANPTSEEISKCSSPELTDSEPTSSSGSSVDSDSDSEAGESSDEEKSGDDEQMDDQPSSSTIPSRPFASLPNNAALRARLANFLPSLKAANEDLEREIAAGKSMTLEVENEDEGQGQLIEMNLGLGVLQEKGEESYEHSDADSESSESIDPKEEKNVIGKLMGKKADLQKPKIEDLGS